jgi:excisionase family DNA binding protein
MTQEEVAAMFGVTIHAVRKWRSKGLIPYMRIGKTVRFDRNEVDRFYVNHRHGPCVDAASAIG